jgi:hypothetical protein
MRLATLARKIKMNPTRLISILEDKGINLDRGSNTKLDNETVDGVLHEFAPELIEIEEVTTDNDDGQDPVESTDAGLDTSPDKEQKVLEKEWSDELELQIDNPVESKTELGEISSAVSPQDEEDEMEVIKAPKIKLPGLKITGKIELPEPPKKPEPDKDREQTEEKKPKKETNKQSRRSNSRSPRRGQRETDYNPLEEARKRAAREKEQSRIREAKKRKEKRRKRYEKEIQSKIQAQSQKKIPETVEAEVVIDTPEAPPPRNIFSKFLRWLNT